MEKMVIFLQTATGHECPGLGLPRECGGEVQLLESSEFGGKKIGSSPAKNGGFSWIRNWPFCDLKAAGSRRDLVSEWNLKALEPDEVTAGNVHIHQEDRSPGGFVELPQGVHHFWTEKYLEQGICFESWHGMVWKSWQNIQWRISSLPINIGLFFYLKGIPYFQPPYQWPFQEPQLEVPTICRGLCKAYVRGYTPKIWPYIVQYLHFRILEFPLIVLFNKWPWSCWDRHPAASSLQHGDLPPERWFVSWPSPSISCWNGS